MKEFKDLIHLYLKGKVGYVFGYRDMEDLEILLNTLIEKCFTEKKDDGDSDE